MMKGPRFLRQKWRSYGWLWRNRAMIRAAHNQTQQLAACTDRYILQRLAPNLFFDQMIEAQLRQAFTDDHHADLVRLDKIFFAS